MSLTAQRGLLALLIIVLSMSSAFAESSAHPKQYSAFDILKAKVLAPAGTAVSAVIQDPQEIVSLEMTGTGTVANSTQSVSVKYSDSATGPFVTPTVNAAYMASVTFTITPTAGTNFKAYPFKYAEFTYTNGGAAQFTLARLTALREKESGKARPVVFTYEDLYSKPNSPLKALSGKVLANGGSVITAAMVGPDPYPVSWSIDGTAAGTGSKSMKWTYSNNAAGPFVAWQDSLSAGFENDSAFTAIDAGATVKPFPALYRKLQLLNSSGAAYTSNSVHVSRKVPVQK